jgi:hypothetical protein
VHGAMAGPKAVTKKICLDSLKTLELEENREKSRDLPIYSWMEKILCVYKSAELEFLNNLWG